MIQEDKLTAIVGKAYVSYEPSVLDAYSKDISFVKAIKPDCVIKPASDNEIKKIVDLANETLTPLVTVSSGSPHFKGDTVPSTGGSTIVDLSRMKKIIRIDRLNRAAMVEPGVTFDELIPELIKEGLRLNMPLVPRKSKSVIGSMLEREPVLMPRYHWDIGDPLCCVEVIYGTGDMFRTGSAAGPGSIEEQWAAGGAQKEAAGPLQASYFRLIQGAQGTMGIVTWASLRCELLPQYEEPYMVGSSQINKLLEMVHWLIRLRLVNECFLVNSTDLAAILAGKWPDDFNGIKESLPNWILFFNLAGYEYFPKEKISYQLKDIKDIAQRLSMEPVQTLGAVSASEVLSAIQKPSGEPYWKLHYKGASQDLFFITVHDKVDDMIKIVNDVACECGYPSSDIGIYIQPIVQGTSCHCEFNLFYNPANSGEVNRVKTLSDKAVIALLSHGAFFSRPYGEQARMIIERDANNTAALKKIKAIFDPHNIMNTGKLCF